MPRPDHASFDSSGVRRRRTPEALPRLTQPLVRVDGELRPVSWELALDRVAEGFAKARASGPDSFGLFSCSKTTNELNYLAQKFARAVMGTNNIDSCNRT